MGLSPSCMSGNAVQGFTKRMKIKSSPSATGVKSKWQSLELVSSNDGAGSHLLHEKCIVEANVECPVFSVAGFEVCPRDLCVWSSNVIAGVHWNHWIRSHNWNFGWASINWISVSDVLSSYCRSGAFKFPHLVFSDMCIFQLQDGRITFIRAKIQ